MPSTSPKTQSEKTGQKPAKVAHANAGSKPEKSKQKTASRLTNKSLTDAEVAKQKTEAAKKTEKLTTEPKPAKPEKPTVKRSSQKIESKKSEKSKKTENNAEVVTVKTSPNKTPNAKSAKNITATSSVKSPKTTPATSKTTIKVKTVTPAKTSTTPKSKPQKTASKSTIKPEEKPLAPQQAQHQPETSKKSTPKNQQNPKVKPFSFLSIFSQVIAVILGFSSLFFIGMLAHLDMLPTHYLLLAILLVVVIAGGFSLLLVRRKFGAIIKVPINILSILFSCVYLVGGGYIAEASGFLDSLKPQEYVSEQYYVIVKNDSAIQDITELKDKTVGAFDEGIELYEEAIKKLNNTVSVNLESIKSVHAMTEGLLSDDFDAAFLSSAHKSVIDEDSADFSKDTKIIYTVEVKVKADSVEEPKVNVTSEPFTIYISGNDSYGDLAARGLSDVNMLATVNPVTHEVLLTSIPRDCFVQLHGTTGGKDKLTHAGLYGVQMSILTIEDLLDINIDYYVKINFPALVNLVDAIGGIDVYSDKTFKPLHGDEIVKEGMNHFDGKMALAFARERMAYTYGDRHRVQNQRDVLNAIIQKVSSSPVILTKTNEILNSLSSNLDTNISKSEISSLVKLQLESMPSWQIGEYMLNGSDLYTYTYTFDDQLRYVMPPYPESIQAAHDYITGIMAGKTLQELNIPEPEKSWK